MHGEARVRRRLAKAALHAGTHLRGRRQGFSELDEVRLVALSQLDSEMVSLRVRWCGDDAAVGAEEAQPVRLLGHVNGAEEAWRDTARHLTDCATVAADDSIYGALA